MAEKWTRMVIARHGITKFNGEDRLLSRVDDPLTDVGRAQARDLKEKLTGYNFHKYYSSPLSRAYETAQIVAGPKRQVKKTRLMIERDFGLLEGTPYYESRQARHEFLIKGESKKFNPYRIETDSQLNNRVIRFLKYISQAYLGLDIFIAAHSGIIRYLLNYLGKKYTDMKETKIKNCSFIEIESNGNDFRFVKAVGIEGLPV